MPAHMTSILDLPIDILAEIADKSRRASRLFWLHIPEFRRDYRAGIGNQVDYIHHVLVYANISHTIWRSYRDKKLHSYCDEPSTIEYSGTGSLYRVKWHRDFYRGKNLPVSINAYKRIIKISERSDCIKTYSLRSRSYWYTIKSGFPSALQPMEPSEIDVMMSMMDEVRFVVPAAK